VSVRGRRMTCYPGTWETTRSKMRTGSGAGLTLGTRELALLLARGDSTVDVELEFDIGEVGNVVVGLDVLLDGLTAVVAG
jgi:hypothetical protein